MNIREPPLSMRKFYAKNIMASPVITLSKVEKVQNIIKVLEETKHNGFPIIDSENRFLGLILRRQLITLLQKKDEFNTDPNVRKRYVL